MSHTPGPRIVRYGEDRVTVDLGPSLGESVKMPARHAAFIADVVREHDSNNQAELVEALRRFENVGLIATTGRTTDGQPSNCTCHVHPELEAALNEVRALLARLEGGQK